ncbi:hypothetical protein ON010_g6726 [Phytophthora cinnamomi]|nr:hypothetical protein ON010_g6726 [Phytophthora cinnamomi]
MELSAWRAAVPYGAYMQPIHLKIAASNPLHSASPACQESPSKSAQKASQARAKCSEHSPNGVPADPSPPEPPTDPETTQNADPLTLNAAGATVIPPYATGGQRGGGGCCSGEA